MKLRRILLITAFMVVGLCRAYAYDIYSGMISINNNLSSSGYVEVDVPFYDDDGLDEALSAGSESGVWINDTKVVDLTALSSKNSAQSTGDSYWCEFVPHLKGTTVEVIAPNGGAELLGSSRKYWYQKRTSTTAYVKLRIYPTSAVLTSGSVKVNVRLHVDKINSDFYDVESTSYFNYTMPTLSNPTFATSTTTPGCQTMNFFGKKAGDSYSFVNPSTGETVEGNVASNNESIAIDLPINNNPQLIEITNSVHISPYQTLEIVTKGTKPAYFMPSTFTAEQNADRDVCLKWVVDADSYDRNYQNVEGNWVVQRANNAAFESPTEVCTIELGSKLTYDKTYTFTDRISDANLNGNYYYRIRRSANTWQWAGAAYRSCSIKLDMQHRYIAEANATLNDGVVTVTWDWDNGAKWTDGSTVYYKRIEVGGSTSAPIELTPAQVKARTFTDNLPKINTYYTYQIYVKPGSSAYAQQEPVDVHSDVRLVNHEMGKLRTLKASKGYYNDCVDLRWTTDGKAVEFFTILARINGSGKEFEQIASLEANDASVNYCYTDSRAVPGLVYDYLVRCNVKCGEDLVPDQGMVDIGFRRPTGEINGRIAFENGQAEEGVVITAEAAEETDAIGSAMSIGDGGKLTVANEKLLADVSDFTFQAWVNPSTSTGKIAEKPGLFTLDFNDNHLRFAIGSQTLESVNTVDEMSDPQTNFLHVTAVASGDSIKLFANGEVIARAKRVYANPTPSGLLTIGEGMHGIIDEVRVWNVALEDATIKRDYTRYLVGNETGLAAYYTFDLCTDDAFFDLSYHGLDYNENHGVIENSALERESVPRSSQLGYRGISNNDGTYAIRSIPFSGNGMSYLIVPQMGNHSFSPVKELRYISASSTVHTVNFTDNSSFLVSGYVTYYGGTVPVEGVEFKVDGVTCTKKGQTVLTDSKGYFEIEVPVGTHEVRAVKEGHYFDNEGKIINSDGTDRNYQDIVTGIEIVDYTQIKYVGRLAGGSEQAELPVGFALSKNNLGNATSVKLRYQNDAYTLATEENTSTEYHYRDGNDEEAPSNEVKFKGNGITIYPNETTGEFVAFIPPLKYAITVDAPGYEAYTRSLGEEKDFSSYIEAKTDVYQYTDSIMDGANKVAVEREEKLLYYVRQNFSVRVAPEIEVKQYRGSALKYYGELEVELGDNEVDAEGNPVAVTLYDHETDSYTVGRPVFMRGVNYQLRAAVHEVYRYRDSTGAEVLGSEPNKVPSKGAIVEFTCGTDGPKKVEADSIGMAYHTFKIKEPDILNPVATVSVKAKVGEEGTYFDWKEGAALKNFIVIGSKRKGSTFITAGPDQLLTVLRDPPGSNSYAYIEEGYTLSRKNSVQNFAVVTSDQGGSHKIGIKNVAPGTGFVQEEKTEVGAGVTEQTKQGGTNTWVAKYTFTQGFQTGSDAIWVGAPADLYIGHSTNMTYGECDIVQFVTAKTYDDVCAGESEKYKSYDAITPDGSAYRLISNVGIDSQLDYGTTFAYTQHYILNTMIPNLKKVRNSMIYQPEELTHDEALAKAALEKEPVYVSKLAPSDPNFGCSDEPTYNAEWDDRVVDHHYYKIYLPTAAGDTKLYSDTIRSINQSVALWEQRIADNERAKLEAKLVQNYSFQGGGSRVSVSESYSYTHSYGYLWTASIVANVKNSQGGSFNGIGADYYYTVKVDDYNGGERSNETSNTAKKGFVLADNNANDYFSVDVLREINDEMAVDKEGDIEMKMPNEGYKPSFVFRTKGGASSCPYEGERVTQFYNPGTVLDVATLQIEGPSLVIENPFVENVPTGEAAAIVLKLANNSDADCTMKFKIKEIEKTNPNGLEMTIDGSALSGGYTIVIPAGQVITKTLLCRKAAVLNYDNVGLKLGADYAGLGVQSEIESKAYFSVHFTPGASAVNIAKPASSWTYNTNLPTRKIDGVDKHYMDIVMDGFDTGYDNFTCIRLQYKPTSASDEEWVTLRNYYVDEELYNEAVNDNKEAYLITAADGGKLTYQWFMDEMMDQNYDLRAIGVSTINNVEYTNASAVRSGVKDMYNPRLFGQPQPANGILGVEDEVRLNFNEPIAEGYLTRNNFSVTGVRNGASTDHSVSVEIQDAEQALTSEFSRNLAGKDVTVEMWVKPAAQGKATWFNYAGESGLRFGITDDNRLSVGNGDWNVVGASAVDFRAAEWAHVALVYDSEGNVDAYYNFEHALTAADAPELPADGRYTFGSSFAGNLHNARIWTKAVRALDLKANSLVQLSGRENNLMAYYPMNEGRGTVVTDRAHSANITMAGEQWTLPAGKAARFDGASYAKINTGAAVVDSTMDFTAELWFKGDYENSNATLLSNGNGEGRDEFCLGFSEGVLQYVNNGTIYAATGNWLDNNWHHVAVAASRTNGRGQICVDGKLNSYFSTENLGGIGAAFAAVGARVNVDEGEYTVDHHFNGTIDEVRLWNVYRNEDMLSEGCNVQLAGDEMGLIAYYPFERYIEYMGTPELVFSLADAKEVGANGTPVADAELVGADAATVATDACAPVKGTGEVSKLLYDFVVNNDAIIINLNEDLNRIENTIVTFTVDGVRDLNGNKVLNPITWSAYVDRNQLCWSDERVDLTLAEGETPTFTVDVVNTGGRNINFAVSNLPTWLEVSATAGKVGPASRQTLTFTVAEGLATGSYTEYIYLTGDNDVNETLVLNVKVNGNKPDWSLNPADFHFSMNLIGKLQIGDEYSNDTDDIVAVFNGGECVGLVNNSYVKQNDSYEVLLTIYGKTSTSTLKLEFYVWDASTGKTYVLTPDRDIYFRQNSFEGSIEYPVLLHAAGDMVQTVALDYGWNWISVAVDDPRLVDINLALAGYDWTVNDIVKSESEVLVGYYYGDNVWTGSLESMTTDLMYLVYTAKPKQLQFGGPQVLGKSITVLGTSGATPRWTYLPYWPSVKKEVNEAMAGYEATAGDILKAQTKFAVYSPTLGWVGNLTAMEPGRGYMLCRNSADNATLRYSNGAAATRPLSVNDGVAEVDASSVYAGNMTVVASLKGVEVQPGDRLVAYVNGEERGEAIVSDIATDGNSLFFLTIAGDSADRVDVALEHNGVQTASCNNVVDYVPNDSHGTVETPFVIDFDRVNAARVYPTVVSDAVHVDVTAEAADAGVVEVFDIAGACIAKERFSLADGQARMQLNVDTWASGVYFVVVSYEGYRESFKIIKK